jgi:16S rRNA (cytidine1402-2'-O)-methyltransferase
MSIPAGKPAAGLYVTATPIGNLKDMTLRAIETLQAADLILCEDTRVTAKLCRAYDIKAPLKAYHDHNAEAVRPLVLEKLQGGEVICLVSDAGTPLISDPGYKLVRAVRDEGLPVFTLPGASAAAAALAIAGAPTDRFFFAGFLPNKSGARQKALQGLQGVPGTLVFYESGPRLAAMLADIATVLGDRAVAVARELTKMHEEVREGAAAELAAAYETAGPPKGEIVVLVHPATQQALSPEEIKDMLAALLNDHRVKEAASIAAEQTGLPRKTLYELALEIKQEGAG